MKTWCVEEKPVPRYSVTTIRVDDEPAPRLKDKPNIFDIPFADAVVSVVQESDNMVVKLHYLDDGGEFHHVELAGRAGEDGEKYTYSFAGLSPDTVAPLGTPRTITIER